jgi:hypothetical protein
MLRRAWETKVALFLKLWQSHAAILKCQAFLQPKVAWTPEVLPAKTLRVFNFKNKKKKIFSRKKKKNLISACGRAFNNSSEGKKKKKKICGN